jgi:hypothetical protein
MSFAKSADYPFEENTSGMFSHILRTVIPVCIGILNKKKISRVLKVKKFGPVLN